VRVKTELSASQHTTVTHESHKLKLSTKNRELNNNVAENKTLYENYLLKELKTHKVVRNQKRHKLIHKKLFCSENILTPIWQGKQVEQHWQLSADHMPKKFQGNGMLYS
jgi:hypothetical protein